MHDFRKVEEKFHEYLKSRLNDEVYRIGEIKITEDLLVQEKAFYISFGWISYFLVIEDEKPVVYANACSRMDLDMIAFIDENGFEDYDVITYQEFYTSSLPNSAEDLNKLMKPYNVEVYYFPKTN